MKKTYKKMLKKKRKIPFFNFLENFCTTGSKMMKNDEKKNKKMKNLKENCNFPFLEKFLHHWKQK